jgi:enoyl-CoA hydratase/carnithine racemase
LRADLAAAVRTRTEHERAEQDRLMQTADFREGLRAVAERRAGRFVRG